MNVLTIFIICMMHSANALFHHHHFGSSPHYTRIHVCLTPPNTMLKVQKHIKECQHEVKTNIFNEAFSLITEHSFKLPHEHIHDAHELHDSFPPGLGDVHTRNLTLTEHEILKFFEEHDLHDYHHFTLPKLLAPTTHLTPTTSLGGASHLESTIDFVHTDPLVTTKINYIEPTPHLTTLHNVKPYVHIGNPFLDRLYKKTEPLHFRRPTIITPAASSTAPVSIPPPKRNPYSYFNIHTGEPIKRASRQRRDTLEYLHPTTATFKDRRIAGCLMHCLYEKDNAIDSHTGYPTLDGLVNFYSDGVHEHAFFMTTLRAVDHCLKGASIKYRVNRHIKPTANVSCDLAFDIFDCVSDKITEYCSHHHYHESHTDHKLHHAEHKPEIHIKPEIHYDYTDEHHFYHHK